MDDLRDAAPAGHTPGPWRARRTGGAIVVTAGPPGSMGRVAIVETVDNAEAEADAHLIEASPALLAAAKAAEVLMAEVETEGAPLDHPFLVVFGQLRAAIAQAEGRS